MIRPAEPVYGHRRGDQVRFAVLAKIMRLNKLVTAGVFNLQFGRAFFLSGSRANIHCSFPGESGTAPSLSRLVKVHGFVRV